MDKGAEGEGGLEDAFRLSHFRVSSVKRGSTGRSKVGAMSRDADFEVPVRCGSGDGPAGSCFCGAGAQEGSLSYSLLSYRLVTYMWESLVCSCRSRFSCLGGVSRTDLANWWPKF